MSPLTTRVESHGGVGPAVQGFSGCQHHTYAGGGGEVQPWLGT